MSWSTGVTLRNVRTYLGFDGGLLRECVYPLHQLSPPPPKKKKRKKLQPLAPSIYPINLLGSWCSIDGLGESDAYPESSCCTREPPLCCLLERPFLSILLTALSVLRSVDVSLKLLARSWRSPVVNMLVQSFSVYDSRVRAPLSIGIRSVIEIGWRVSGRRVWKGRLWGFRPLRRLASDGTDSRMENESVVWKAVYPLGEAFVDKKMSRDESSVFRKRTTNVCRS